MKLYSYFRSSAAYRARIALNLKSIQYESIHVDLLADGGEQRKPEYLAVNPQGLVPALVTEGVTITQSLAIIEYLEETHPHPPLLPRKAVDRAQVRAMALTIACDVHPLNNLRVLNYLRSTLGQEHGAVRNWYQHWIAEGFRALEHQARHSSDDGRYLFGSAVTIADVFVVPQMFNARRFKCDLEPYPTLRSVCAHLEALPPFAKAAPQAQPEAS
jgi:maleylacetoacetate isomerase